MDVGIIILTKGKIPYLTQCLTSIIEKTKNTEYTIYIGDTGSTVEEMDQLRRFIVDNFPKRNIKLIQLERYNFARNNNTIVTKYVTEPFLLFCNNDINLIDNCIDKLARVYQAQQNIGTLGCRLLYEDSTIQHAGMTMWTNERNMLEITHRGLGTKTEFKDLEKVVGNTAGFMMISKKLFEEVGKFNTNYGECFEDVELNMKCILKGYDNYYTDTVKAYHYESITRTRSEEAIKLLHLDYSMNLFPFFRKLTDKQQKLLLEVSL